MLQAALAQQVARILGKEILTGSNNFILSYLGAAGSAHPW